ncbi:MAG: four helix bundle protein [Vicinamibacterales bacterium]
MSLPHQKLVAWQRADELVIEIHRLTHQRLPALEQRELGSQLRRAAFSVAANIVEGTVRWTSRDALRFFNIASASLAELGYGLHVAHRLGYIDLPDLHAFEAKVRMVSAPLHGLIRRYRSGRVLTGLTIALLAGTAHSLLS